ncbi:flagella biosynthesis regulator [Klebsiella pneumoniae]|nr:flagella biosynthesis regulator [Klebsiella pneumoniae]
MDVNSTGNQNRISGRDFNENNIQIDKFDGSHTINIAIPSEKHDERPLVKAQRKELNTLVATVSATCGGEAYEIWQKLHAEIGVSSIEEMTVNQYQTAISYLQAMIERIKDRDASKVLVSLLLRNSEDSELRQKLIRYCHVNFGTGRLNDLTRSQLQMSLSWLDQQIQNTGSTIPEQSNPRYGLFALLKTYPKHTTAVFLSGAIVGALLVVITNTL